MKHLQRLDDISISATELAKLVGCSLQYLARLRKEKVVEWIAPSRYALVDSVQKFLAYQRAGTKYAGSETAQALKQEQVRRLKLANDERERNSIPLSESMEAMETLCAIVRLSLDGVAKRIARDIEGQRRAQDEIDRCLHVIADALERLSKGLKEGDEDPSRVVAGVFSAAQGNREASP